MSEPILGVSNVTAAYARTPVLRDVSLSLDRGEILAIVGPNGSGKSSLLKLVLGSLSSSGSGGVSWFGRPLSSWRRRELARRVAYLPQAPSSLAGQRVADVLASGRAPYWGAFGIESLRDREAVAEAAEMLGLNDWLDRDLSTLSGGQRQRVFIGRCVVQTLGGEPASRGVAAEGAILLDEPDTFLDLRHIVELTAILRMVARDHRLGILLASHDLNLAAGIADRMILLSDGVIAAAGTPAEVMQPEVIERTYGVKVTAVDAAGRCVLVPLQERL